MQRKDHWTLTVHYYPSAVLAGVEPTKGAWFSPDPAVYQPHSFLFAHPPSREDFLEMCLQLPWTHCWRNNLFSLLKKHAWPMIDMAHKAASVDLRDTNGRQVGKIEVSREWCYQNQNLNVPFVSTALVDQTCNRLRKSKREAAKHTLGANCYRIMERLAGTPGGCSDEAILDALEDVLIEAGLLSRKLHKPVCQAL